MSWWRRWNESLDAQDTFGEHSGPDRARWAKRLALSTAAATAVLVALVAIANPDPVLFAALLVFGAIMLALCLSVARGTHVMRAARNAVLSLALVGVLAAAFT